MLIKTSRLSSGNNDPKNNQNKKKIQVSLFRGNTGNDTTNKKNNMRVLPRKNSKVYSGKSFIKNKYSTQLNKTINDITPTIKELIQKTSPEEKRNTFF